MNIKKLNCITGLLCLFTAALVTSFTFSGCKHTVDGHYTLTGDTIADGKNLVQMNCTRCHSLVTPDALTKDVWKFHTLPAMAHYMGITPYMDGYFKKDSTGLTLLEWQSIVTYYNKLAPVSLPPAKAAVKAAEDWAGFKLKMPPASNNVVFTTMAAINPFNHNVYTADGVTGNLTGWSSSFKASGITKLPSPGINASFTKTADSAGEAVISCIGQMERLDFPNGKVVSLSLDSKNVTPKLIGSELARPVQTISGDFNKDGLADWVVCGQGYTKGGVYLYRQNKDHNYTQTIITGQPGAVQALSGDFNGDGWPDLMILFGYNDEGISLFLNDHKGNFTSKKLLTFPPVYGSSSFQLADLDHDGKPDLIYTCGYNFKDSRILKPYHGMYIYKNTGDWNFKQQWFYPINGCTKAIAADFDGDGDMDIVTSAFFADLQNNPAEGCIYFENEKPFSFKPHAIPIWKYGRWFNMDVGDYNNDGKPDIVLANYSTGFLFQPGLIPFWSKNIPFIVLENNFKK